MPTKPNSKSAAFIKSRKHRHNKFFNKIKSGEALLGNGVINTKN
jgi:hypothetical protein